MPAKSQAQQRLMAMALHNPSSIYSKNKGVTKMSDSQLEEFAKTKRSKLPKRIVVRKKR
jgi:hypothetical protein